MSTAFNSLALRPELVANLDGLGYQEMTEIQAACLPAALEGKDLIAQAKTGSGKTAAFGLALLQRLKVERFRIQAMVLCPTRELADQVAKELRRLGRGVHNIKILTLCGGVSIGPQLGSLEHGAHIIVGTPGRIQDHLRKGSLNLENLHTLIFDEADRMLDMGFSESIADIASYCPTDRQTLLFSATYPEGIEKISRAYQKNPQRIQVASRHTQQQIVQRAYAVDDEYDKINTAHRLLCQQDTEATVIFCATKIQTTDVARALSGLGWTALALNGDMEQKDRDQTLVRFSNASANVLVATDVAARGLDVEAVGMVINFDLPRDPEIYVHRIGRTGRAGREGLAVSLVNDRQRRDVKAIEEYLKQELPWSDVPNETMDADLDQRPQMVTLGFDSGKKSKLRPGDILGALTGAGGIEGKQVGKINIFLFHAYVAVHRSVANRALKCLQEGKIKGKNVRVRKVTWSS